MKKVSTSLASDGSIDILNLPSTAAAFMCMVWIAGVVLDGLDALEC